MTILPDTKNWTWVLEQVCPDCGFDASAAEVHSIGVLVRRCAAPWPALLADDNSRLRPIPEQWSALEYGCHVRDVFRLFDQRLLLMLEHDDPTFSNWDQDATAIDERYDLQAPTTVSAELLAAGENLADRFDSVVDGQWQRTGRRSDGALFTVESFARYLLHDPVHHLDDVGRGNSIIAASEASARSTPGSDSDA